MNRIVKASEAEFWQAFSSFCPPGGFFDARGTAQRELDLRLTGAIDALLVPKLGAWQGSASWRHEFGVYRDGVHSLMFAAASFEPEFVPSLQSLLVGDHDVYCILAQVWSSLEASGASRIGSLAVRSNRLLVSYPLVKYLNGRI